MKLPRRALIASAVVAGAAAATRGQGVEDKPFADHKLALQLSDWTDAARGLIVSVPNNLLAVYGPDSIAIEVVTFAQGVRLLYAGAAERSHVDSLVSQGVRFSVCMNTIDTIARQTGRAPDLNPHAIKVVAGVARLLELSAAKYTIVRP
ncbi:MAG: hypothetical protein KGI57_12020 [Hyphomicrobiales bacterium]|nr:hypothetical protein [Hyphomicrobiales bacterium]MDE2018415.1 hypothetical protein [Hyphomicrobiales bacterium]